MRILSWNVDGIAKWLGGDELARYLGTLGDFDVICLQEVRLRPVDREQLRDLLPGYTVAASLADDPRNVTFRGGRAYGVATFVRGTSSSASPAWDREGRVLVTTVSGFAIVNLYAVNGTAKPYIDPATGAALGDRHAFKQRFQTHVLALAGELEQPILVGDWNVSQTTLDVTPRLRTEEPHATARAQLLAGFAAGGWVDAFRARSPDARRYTWFGKTRLGALDAARVDYFIVRRELVPRVRDARILDRGPRSDHAPIVLEVAPRVQSSAP